MLILKNANIIDVNNPAKTDHVLVIDHGQIVAVGDDNVLAQFAAKAEVQDVGGGWILPGLTDAHIHLQQFAQSLAKVNVELPAKEMALAEVALKAKATPKGEWIFGHGFQHNDWGGDLPTRQDLDAIAPEHPVYLTGKSLHLGWANSLGLKLCGIGVSTSDPENGVIVRDKFGEPTGVLLESAMTLFESRLPVQTSETIADQIEQAIPHLWRYGITAVHDFDYRPALVALQSLDIAGKLKLRVVKNIPVNLLDHAAGLGLRTGFGSDFLKIGSVKIFMDGALGAKTAAMIDPYQGDPGNLGILNMDGEEFFEIAAKAVDSGLGLTGHAIGDKAVHEILNGYERLRNYEREKGYKPLRHRIEHVQLLHPLDAPRLAQLDIIASMQPIHASSDMEAADKYWGNRVNLSYAWRSQVNAGATLAFGSDSPVESPNPFWGLYAAVNRKKLSAPETESWVPDQALDLATAIRAYTVGAAYAGYQEGQLGQLRPGFHADLIVLEKDPFKCSAAELRELLPISTMVAGNWVL